VLISTKNKTVINGHPFIPLPGYMEVKVDNFVVVLRVQMIDGYIPCLINKRLQTGLSLFS